MPLFINPQTGRFTSRKASLGALGDSYYEYLLKLWLLQGRRDDMYRAMWERVSRAARSRSSAGPGAGGASQRKEGTRKLGGCRCGGGRCGLLSHAAVV